MKKLSLQKKKKKNYRIEIKKYYFGPKPWKELKGLT